MLRRSLRQGLGCVLSVMLSCVSLAGCAATPEKALVKQKGTASLGNYEEGSTLEEKIEDSHEMENESQEGANTIAGETGTEGNLLQSILGAPENYESTVTDATGKLTVHTKAEVEIPDAEKVSAIYVSQYVMNQEQINLIEDVFFKDGKIYDKAAVYQMTKEDCMEKIQELKGYAAQGNLDPYGQGKDENGNYIYDIYKAIEALEQDYENAPQEVEWAEVSPTLQQIQTDDGRWYNDDFLGYVVMPDGTEYVWNLYGGGRLSMDVEISKVHIDAVTGEKDTQSARPWVEYTSIDSQKTNMKNFPSKEELMEYLGLTQEEAQAIAEEKIEALGLTDMELNDWDYGVFCADHSSVRVDVPDVEVQDYGFIFHYARAINGIPLTYTIESGGNLESMESDMATWGYEKMDVVVTKDGIDKLDFYNRYDIGETKTENLNLLSFDEIMQIYEKMILIQNANVTNFVEKELIDINRITFGYSRIYEPAASSQTGILVPVWDFFGVSERQYEERDGSMIIDHNNCRNQSYITINAVDGSIIDRGLGY